MSATAIIDVRRRKETRPGREARASYSIPAVKRARGQSFVWRQIFGQRTAPNALPEVAASRLRPTNRIMIFRHVIPTRPCYVLSTEPTPEQLTARQPIVVCHAPAWQ